MSATAPMLMSWCPGQKCDPCHCIFYPASGLGVDPPGQNVAGSGYLQAGSHQHLRFKFGDRYLCTEKVALIVYHQDSGVIGDYVFGLNWQSHETITYAPTPPSLIDGIWYYNPPHVVSNLDGSGNVQLLLNGIQIFAATVSASGQWDTISSDNEYLYAIDSSQPLDSPIYAGGVSDISRLPGDTPYQKGFTYSGPYQLNSTFDLIFTPAYGSLGNWSPTLPSLFYAPVNV